MTRVFDILLVISLSFSAVVMLMLAVLSRPDLRIHNWLVRRHNRRRGGTLNR